MQQRRKERARSIATNEGVRRRVCSIQSSVALRGVLCAVSAATGTTGAPIVSRASITAIGHSNAPPTAVASMPVSSVSVLPVSSGAGSSSAAFTPACVPASASLLLPPPHSTKSPQLRSSSPEVCTHSPPCELLRALYCKGWVRIHTAHPVSNAHCSAWHIVQGGLRV